MHQGIKCVLLLIPLLLNYLYNTCMHSLLNIGDMIMSIDVHVGVDTISYIYCYIYYI